MKPRLKSITLLSLCLLATGCRATKETSSPSTTPSSKASQSQTTATSKTSSSKKLATSNSSSKSSTPQTSTSQSTTKSDSTTTSSSSTSASSKPEQVLVPFSQVIQGTWKHQDQHSEATIIFGSDGTVTNTIVYNHAPDSNVQQTEQYSQLIKIADNLYRLPENSGGIALIPVTGLGGLGKMAIGLYLAPDGTLYPQSWGMPIDADLDTYDYASNINKNWPMTRVE